MNHGSEKLGAPEPGAPGLDFETGETSDPIAQPGHPESAQ
jgi:hypothetical protein